MPGKAGLQIPRPFFKWIRTLLEDLFVHRAFLSSRATTGPPTRCAQSMEAPYQWKNTTALWELCGVEGKVNGVCWRG